MEAKAFSLSELLVVIVIVVILISLVLPAVARFRRNSAQSLMASDLRQHAIIFTTYSNDFRGFMPYFTDPINSPMVLTEPVSGIQAGQTFYFDAKINWPLALSAGYYAGNIKDATFQPPNQRTGRRDIISPYGGYLYPCVYIADPKFFSEDRLNDRSQLRATQLSEVLFPSDKALVVNQRWWQEGWGESGFPAWGQGATSAPIHVAMVDTAWVPIPGDRHIWHRFGDGPDPDIGRDPSGNMFVASHTWNGVRGRDR